MGSMNRDSMIIDGRHFGGVMQAVCHMIKLIGYRPKDVELVCNDELEIYELRAQNRPGETMLPRNTPKYIVLATIPY